MEDKKLQICELPSEHFDERSEACVIDTIVIHSMYNPEHQQSLSVKACKDILDQYEVSAHYLIDREGQVYNLVKEACRAWHAGPSKMPFISDIREGVNQFSIGIELIGNEETGFTDKQYLSLAALTQDIITRHPISNICGHCHIAPERKSDPWNFDWERYKQMLEGDGISKDIIFPEAT